MKSNQNMRQLQETCINRGVVTSRNKKYCPAILVGFKGISDELVTSI
jgi:hypothetical protein